VTKKNIFTAAVRDFDMRVCVTIEPIKQEVLERNIHLLPLIPPQKFKRLPFWNG
jgi:hypothetical protein